MLRNILSGILIAIVCVAVWRYFGGDANAVATNIAAFVANVVDIGANAMLDIFAKAQELF